MAIANNSYVGLDSIGNDDASALLCHTDNTDCCTPNGHALGNWYSASGHSLENDNGVASGHGMEDLLPQSSLIVTRDVSIVRLLRRNELDSPLELGQIYCEIPNAEGVNQRIYISLCKSPILLPVMTS